MSGDARLEAVARAMCEARGLRPDAVRFGWGSAYAGRPAEMGSYYSNWQSLVPEARAALAAADAVAGDGWVLVPREPLPEMVGAYWRVKNGHHYHDEPAPTDTSDYAAYRAMIAAAPQDRS